MGGGKCGLIAGCVVLIILAGMLLANPLPSANFNELNNTVQMIALILGFVGIVGLIVIFATGSTFVNGNGNSWNNTTNIHINEQPSSQEVNRWMNGD